MKQRISKGCSETNNQALNIGFFDRARDAFGSALDAIGLRPGDRVLLPAYIGWSSREGSGVFDPISERGICPVFYKLDRRLNIDTDDAITKMGVCGVKAILLIHYFGFVAPQCKEITKAANDHGIPVIEDAAHAMFTDFVGGGCGRYGDYTVYSLHKMLPMESGGMLLANRGNRLPIDASSYCKYGNPFHYDFGSISQKRIENYGLISSYIGAGTASIIPLHRKLPKSVIPQTYPIFLPFDNRDDVYREMNDLGWGVVSLYHTMINSIEKGEFCSTHELSKHILNLPVHQDIDSNLISLMIEDLFETVKKYSGSVGQLSYN